MNRITLSILPLGVLIAIAGCGQEALIQPRVSVVRAPDASREIHHTIANREPLLRSPLAKLPLGTVQPHGWIRHQLDLMTRGMVGRLKEVSPFLGDDNGWLEWTAQDKDGWEEQPYWLRGFYDLGVLTNDERIRKESLRWIEAVIASQQEDGYFGPKVNRLLQGQNRQLVCDLWPHMVMLDAVRSHWEVTGDEKVVEFALRFFEFCRDLPEQMFVPPINTRGFGHWRPFIQTTRSGDMLPHIYWLYNLTGKKWLLRLATRFHEHVEPPQSKWLNHHIVHFTQRFREPGNYYLQSRNPKHLAETEEWYQMHMETWGQQPGGVFAADEQIRPGKTDPKQGFETCGMVEFNKSFYILGQITGQTLYADRVEDITFNSFPPSQMPDLKGLHYITAGNQPQLDAGRNHDYYNKPTRMISYSPHIGYRCCQHNVAMGWPDYAEHLWMAAAGDGLAAWLYGACEVTAKVGKDKEVTIREETDYPFDTTVKMTVTAARRVAFPLYLRVPRWCNGFSVTVNGEALGVQAEPGKYVLIERTWRDGDLIEITMPVKLSLTVWKKSANSVTVNRGPLSFSLKISEEWRKIPTRIEGWPEWEVFPTTPWNYGLIVDKGDLDASFEVVEKGSVPDQPWTVEDAPIEIKAKGKRIPNWTLVDQTVTALQPSPIRSDEPVEDITLVPMGCARLRMSCLPTIGDGEDAHEWQKVTRHKPFAINLDFETTPIGQPAFPTIGVAENAGDSIGVTDETAADGERSMKIVDSPGLAYASNPRAVYRVEHREGVSRCSFDLRVEKGVNLLYDWRQRTTPYIAGPSMWVRKGKLGVGEQKLIEIPIGEWMHFEIVAGVGSKLTGTWDLTVTPPGQEPRRFEKLKHQSGKWKSLEFMHFDSPATDTAVFYIDNLMVNNVLE